MESGGSVRIENSSRAHAESLQLALVAYDADLVQDQGAWQVEVQLGELAELLVKLFDDIGAWLTFEQVDSLLLHFDERRYTLLRPTSERVQDSSAFLLERVAQLETALEARIVVEQAKGVIARALDLSVDAAFELLRTTARSRRTRIQVVAAEITATPAEAERVVARPPRHHR